MVSVHRFVYRPAPWAPDAQVKAFRLLVNRSVNWADWDSELLSLELADLKELEFDLALTGFDVGEIDDLLLGDGGEGVQQGTGEGGL